VLLLFQHSGFPRLSSFGRKGWGHSVGFFPCLFFLAFDPVKNRTGINFHAGFFLQEIGNLFVRPAFASERENDFGDGIKFTSAPLLGRLLGFGKKVVHTQYCPNWRPDGNPIQTQYRPNTDPMTPNGVGCLLGAYLNLRDIASHF